MKKEIKVWDKFDYWFALLEVYMDWYVESIAINYMFPMCHQSTPMSFEKFRDTESGHTNKPWALEWIWKWPDRFSAKTKTQVRAYYEKKNR